MSLIDRYIQNQEFAVWLHARSKFPALGGQPVNYAVPAGWRGWRLARAEMHGPTARLQSAGRLAAAGWTLAQSFQLCAAC